MNSTAGSKQRIGWIGIGRMGYAMAERLAKAGADVTVWNRTRAKAEPLATHGAKIAGRVSDLAACDIVFCMVSTWDDVKRGDRGAKRIAIRRARAEAGHRMLVDLARGLGRAAYAARRARRRAPRGAGVGQRQGDQGRQAVVRLLGAAPRVRRGASLPEDDRASGELGRRRRARAHRQDLPQRLPRCGDAIARGDHRAGAKGGRAAPRFSRIHEPERDGLDVLALQDAGVREPRLQGDVHARAAAQGSRPRPRCRTTLRGADAARLAHARHRANLDRKRVHRAGFRDAADAASEGVRTWRSNPKTWRSTTACPRNARRH